MKRIKILEIKKKDLVMILDKMKGSSLDFTGLYLLYFSEKDRDDIATFDKEIVNQKLRGYIKCQPLENILNRVMEKN